MKLFSYLIITLCFIPYSYGQKSPIKFGVIPMEDMEMKSYPLDTSASAVVLTDFGHASINVLPSTIQMEFQRHIRIKVLKKEGLDWANGVIELYHDGIGSPEERVNGLKASTYNLEDGKIVETKMAKEAVFKEKFNKNLNLHKFTLPNVKEGSIIEYSYTLSSEHWSTFPDWEFQRTIPTRWSEFWAMVPEELIYNKYMQGYVQIESKNPKYNWIAKDVPAFKPEPYMTSEREYKGRINFSLARLNLLSGSREIMASWEKLNENLNESEAFGQIIRGSSYLKKDVDAITAGISEPQAKLAAIFNHVRNTITWTGVKDYLAESPKKIFESKKGSSGDINLALASMLTKAGFDVDMVLLSTRDHGFIREYVPMSKQFNYVICMVRLGDKNMFLDATDRYLPMGVLPERCLNIKGLIISKTNFGWTPLDAKVKAKTIVSADFKLDAAGALDGKIVYTRDGYTASDTRNQYFTDGEETFLQNRQKGKTWDYKSLKLENTKEIEKPVNEIHEVSISDHVTATGPQLYLSPFITGQLDENPFQADKRVYPVDFSTPQEFVYMSKFTLPDGYQVEELPKNKILALPANAGRFVYNMTVTGNNLQLTCILSINKPLFVQDEYEVLREFYNQVIAKESEQIVLKKVGQ